jgi:hypothetical protein
MYPYDIIACLFGKRKDLRPIPGVFLPFPARRTRPGAPPEGPEGPLPYSAGGVFSPVIASRTCEKTRSLP